MGFKMKSASGTDMSFVMNIEDSEDGKQGRFSELRFQRFSPVESSAILRTQIFSLLSPQRRS